MIPPKNELVICFAHVAYRLDERFAALGTGIRSFVVRDPETLSARIAEADVLVISGLWNNALLDRASRLRLLGRALDSLEFFYGEKVAVMTLTLKDFEDCHAAPTDGGYVASSRAAIEAFRSTLVEHGVPATIRLTRGRDIDAACGQLAAKAREPQPAQLGTP